MAGLLSVPGLSRVAILWSGTIHYARNLCSRNVVVESLRALRMSLAFTWQSQQNKCYAGLFCGQLQGSFKLEWKVIVNCVECRVFRFQCCLCRIRWASSCFSKEFSDNGRLSHRRWRGSRALLPPQFNLVSSKLGILNDPGCTCCLIEFPLEFPRVMNLKHSGLIQEVWVFSKWRQCSVQQAVVAYFEMPTIGFILSYGEIFLNTEGNFFFFFS